MKTWRIIFALAVVIVAAFGIWRLTMRQSSAPAVMPSSSQPTPAPVDAEESADESPIDPAKTIERLGPYAGLSAHELWKLRPPMRKSEVYPPKTAAQFAMWQWWRAMRQADGNFEHKTPIEFYGKVVDQNNQPIGGATVNLQWSIIGGTDNRTLKTESDGRFSITGIQGKGISVYAFKSRYLTGLRGKGSYEYAGFYEHNFHVPDPNNPVVFQLWKLGESEPMYKWIASVDLSVDGKPTSVDIKTGRISSAGELSFSVMRDEQPGSRQSGYTLTVRAANGGGIATSSDEEF
ncbi:MAG TPA: carboxypeptidase-like regulatory domain-containing protein, partial [Luteolibacter sp.]|nr:carboxypeptidase-like regulatory domain-containing protein [Luteolibacter sp.]